MDHQHDQHSMDDSSANKTAFLATWHCLTGCAIGEVIGMIISTAWHWTAGPSVAISIVLAFIFGYSYSLQPLVRHGMSLRRALRIALAADTASIATMEVSDNLFILAVPGAINAGLNTGLFWLSLVLSLIVAFAVAFPVNKWLIGRGKGHALMHEHAHHH